MSQRRQEGPLLRALCASAVKHTRRLWAWAALLAIALGGGFRLWTLERRNLWADEAISWHRAQMPAGKLLVEMRRQLHPPAYFLALRGWCLAAGETTARSMRLFSAVCSLAGIGLCYLLARRLFSPSVAAVSAVLLALSPHQVFFGQEARMYALATALGLAATFCLVRFLQGSPRGWLWGYIGTTVLAVHTHYIMWLLVAAQAVGVAWGYGRRGTRYRPVLLAMGAVVLLAAPWLVGLNLRAARQTAWGAPGSTDQLLERTAELLKDVAGARFVELNQVPFLVRKYRAHPEWLFVPRDLSYLGQRVAVVAGGASLGFLILLSVAAVVAPPPSGANRSHPGAGAPRFEGLPERRLVGCIAFLPFAVFLVVLLVRDFATTRYLAPFVPFMLLAAVSTPRWRAIKRPLIGIVLAGMIIGGGVDRRQRSQQDDYRPVVQWFGEHASHDEPIVADPNYMGWLLECERLALGVAEPPVIEEETGLGARPPHVWFLADSRSALYRRPGDVPQWLAPDYEVRWEHTIDTWFTKVRIARLSRRGPATTRAASPADTRPAE